MVGSSENDSSGLMGLSAALEGLREELESAWEKSARKAIRFGVGEVTLTLEAVARRDAQAGGKIRWWLIEAGGDVKTGRETTQTMVLKLTPGLYDEQGNRRPLEVAGPQEQPEG